MTGYLTVVLILVLGGYFALLVWTRRDNEVVRETTFADAVARFADAMRDLQQQVGLALLPAVRRLTDAMAGFRDAFGSYSPGYQVNLGGGSRWSMAKERASSIRWALAYLARAGNRKPFEFYEGSYEAAIVSQGTPTIWGRQAVEDDLRERGEISATQHFCPTCGRLHDQSTQSTTCPHEGIHDPGSKL